MNKMFLGLALLSVPALAGVEAGRSLPKGEEHPSFIEKVFSSPVGDLEFTLTGERHSVLLRNAKGGLSEMTRLSGGAVCDQWFLSDKSEAMPQGCEFQFYGLGTGSVTVRSDEVEKSDLFQTVRGRGKNVAL